MPLRLCWLFAAAAACAPALHASGVQAPPLPAGSAKARVEPGLSKPERDRHIRAHHHKGHYKKDHTRDDSIPEAAPAPAPRNPPKSGKKQAGTP